MQNQKSEYIAKAKYAFKKRKNYNVVVHIQYVCFVGVLAAVAGDGTAGYHEHCEGATQR